uniref:Uncharacterized protein n=1 Tax=Chromera velia CCMP2878 TaxID=1169474 RepID=A0A0G4GSJ0_9ALVE|eukprot:Cvel_23199.t1-p1 / transcript=Cvel_23199.t1 / gene=Cvel_23199 / organism=Chromera_velia_CCMP2878 / gene_product=hypothetical protein / transcript_product=hypothetical protein / location=Cvel_scaffold2364:12555-14051(+) / protein_length=450 / sequence_SO=supercontig / SO=protein_coding / is_pseudo=false
MQQESSGKAAGLDRDRPSLVEVEGNEDEEMNGQMRGQASGGRGGDQKVLWPMALERLWEEGGEGQCGDVQNGSARRQIEGQSEGDKKENEQMGEEENAERGGKMEDVPASSSSSSPPSSVLSESQLRILLERERAERTSEKTLALFERVEKGETDQDWLDIVDTMQRRILKQSGFVASNSGNGKIPKKRFEKALFEMRTAHRRFPSLATIPIQVRYQRAGPCPVPENSVLSNDVPLFLASSSAAPSETSLFAFLDTSHAAVSPSPPQPATAPAAASNVTLSRSLMSSLLFVYIEEAHAEDEWPIRSARFNADRGPVNLPQSHSLERRRQNAVSFAKAFDVPFPVLLDPPAGGQPLSQEEGGVSEQPAAAAGGAGGSSSSSSSSSDEPVPPPCSPRQSSQGPFASLFRPWPARLLVFEGRKLIFASVPSDADFGIALCTFLDLMSANAALQ